MYKNIELRKSRITLKDMVDYAKSCSSRTQFYRGRTPIVRRAQQLGILDLVVSHVPSQHPDRTYLKMRELALQYDCRSIFRKNHWNDYRWAKSVGILESICRHMKPLIIRWTKEMCMEEAAKYNKRSQWEKHSPSSYKQACRKGWLKSCIHTRSVS